jgi:Zn-dependent peptidase ImmA (M78 family)
MAVVRFPVTGDVLKWAVQRSGIGTERVHHLFPDWDAWIAGKKQPTLKQIEAVSRVTHTPVGFFYLSEPVTVTAPIPDFRRMATQERRELSPDLIDVIHSCQLRQSWYREDLASEGVAPLSFVGSVTTNDDVLETAAKIRTALSLSDNESSRVRTFTDMLRLLRQRIEDNGVLVFISGIVGSDTHRTLDPAEFRGFALTDEYAPVVFVNGADTKAAQIFTLIHEYTHVWLGSSALSDVGPLPGDNTTEAWCNRVAAEVLVPIGQLWIQRQPEVSLQDEITHLARVFKVSTLVVLRRLFDAGVLDHSVYYNAYDRELERLLHIEPRRTDSGGDFYNSTLVRTGNRFARAVLSSAWEGRTSFTEAMRMLGIRNMSTLRSLSSRLAVYS